MTLGMRPRKGGWMTAGRGGSGAVAAQIAACGLFVLLLAGCGGGGGGGSNNNATPTPSGGSVTVTGTVLDSISGTPDPGVVVSFGKYYTLVGPGGTFSLSIPSETSGSVLIYGEDTLNSAGTPVLGSNGLPTSNGFYQDTGQYLGVYTSLSVSGIPIAATAAGKTISLGTITLSNQNEPPAPPINF